MLTSILFLLPSDKFYLALAFDFRVQESKIQTSRKKAFDCIVCGKCIDLILGSPPHLQTSEDRAAS